MPCVLGVYGRFSAGTKRPMGRTGARQTPSSTGDRVDGYPILRPPVSAPARRRGSRVPNQRAAIGSAPQCHLDHRSLWR